MRYRVFFSAILVTGVLALSFTSCRVPLGMDSRGGTARLSISVRLPALPGQEAFSRSGARLLHARTSSVRLSLSCSGRDPEVQEQNPDAEGVMSFTFENVPARREVTLLAEAFDSDGVYARSERTRSFDPGPVSLPLVLFPSDPEVLEIGFDDAIPVLPANTTRIYQVTPNKSGDWSLYLDGDYPEAAAWGPDGLPLSGFSLSTRTLTLPGMTAGQSAYIGVWSGNSPRDLTSQFLKIPEGEVDDAFGTDGMVAALGDILVSDEAINDMILLSDGRIVAVGGYKVDPSDDTTQTAFIAMFLNGKLDQSFNSGASIPGILFFNPGAERSEACACALQTISGTTRVIVAGRSTYMAMNSDYRYFITRVNLNGTIDTGFATSGHYNPSIINSAWDYNTPPDVIVDPDGDIVMSASTADSAQLLSLRGVLADGSGPNTDFGSGGFFQAAVNNYLPTSLALSGGYLFIASYSSTTFNITRIAENGQPAASVFGSVDFIAGGSRDTLQVTNADYSEYRTGELAVSSASGTELLYLSASRVRDSGGSGYQELSLGVFRASNGTARHTSGLFDSTGVWTSNLGEAGDIQGYDVLVDSSGNMTVCGGGDAAAAVRIRYNGGTPVVDASGFNSSGGARFFSSASLLSAAVLRPNGNLVFGGYSVESADDRDLFLTECPPTGAAAIGAWNEPLARESCVFNDVAVQRDGRIVAVGNFGASRGIVARFLPDGRPDSSFNGDGVRIIESSGTNTIGFCAVDIGLDGNIFVVGSFVEGALYHGYLAHLAGSDGSDGPIWAANSYFSPSAFTSVAVDGQGYAYAGGSYDGEAVVVPFQLDGNPGTAIDPSSGAGSEVRDLAIGPGNVLHIVSQGVNILHYDTVDYSGGVISEPTDHGTIDSGEGSCTDARIAIDGQGSVYIVATNQDGADYRPYVRKYGADYALLWANASVDYNSYPSTYGIAVHPGGNVYLSGTWAPASGANYSYIAALGTSGTLLLGPGAVTVPNSGFSRNQSRAMAITPSGDIALAGDVLNTGVRAAVFLVE